jgi:hypothetical protein
MARTHSDGALERIMQNESHVCSFESFVVRRLILSSPLAISNSGTTSFSEVGGVRIIAYSPPHLVQWSQPCIFPSS